MIPARNVRGKRRAATPTGSTTGGRFVAACATRLVPPPPMVASDGRDAVHLTDLDQGEDVDNDKTVVLIADDDETILKLLTRSLQGFCDVLQARDGAQAVDMFRLGEDVIDVVLLDLGMPGLSGYEALAQLQLLDPDVRVAVITGMDPDQERLPGVRRILTKPFRPDEVVKLVKELVPA